MYMTEASINTTKEKEGEGKGWVQVKRSQGQPSTSTSGERITFVSIWREKNTTTTIRSEEGRRRGAGQRTQAQRRRGCMEVDNGRKVVERECEQLLPVAQEV